MALGGSDVVISAQSDPMFDRVNAIVVYNQQDLVKGLFISGVAVSMVAFQAVDPGSTPG